MELFKFKRTVFIWNIFCNYGKDFTFDQFNAFLLNKNKNFFKYIYIYFIY